VKEFAMIIGVKTKSAPQLRTTCLKGSFENRTIGAATCAQSYKSIESIESMQVVTFMHLFSAAAS
jgi:hypothetical protein